MEPTNAKSGNKTHCDICNSKAARKARSKREHVTEESATATTAGAAPPSAESGESASAADEQAAANDQPPASVAPAPAASSKEGTRTHCNRTTPPPPPPPPPFPCAVLRPAQHHNLMAIVGYFLLQIRNNYTSTWVALTHSNSTDSRHAFNVASPVCNREMQMSIVYNIHKCRCR